MIVTAITATDAAKGPDGGFGKSQIEKGISRGCQRGTYAHIMKGSYA